MAADTSTVETPETTETESKETRVPRQLVWNTKEFRENGKGDFVLIGSLDTGKFELVGQLEGKGRKLDQSLAEALGVEESELAKKLGKKDVIAVTTRYAYVSRQSDRPKA